METHRGRDHLQARRRRRRQDWPAQWQGRCLRSRPDCPRSAYGSRRSHCHCRCHCRWPWQCRCRSSRRHGSQRFRRWPSSATSQVPHARSARLIGVRVGLRLIGTAIRLRRGHAGVRLRLGLLGRGGAVRAAAGPGACVVCHCFLLLSACSSRGRQRAGRRRDRHVSRGTGSRANVRFAGRGHFAANRREAGTQLAGSENRPGVSGNRSLTIVGPVRAGSQQSGALVWTDFAPNPWFAGGGRPGISASSGMEGGRRAAHPRCRLPKPSGRASDAEG